MLLLLLLIQYSSGSSVIVEISNLNKVKESYTEDLLLGPKRKVHKPVKGVLKLEVEKLHTSLVDVGDISDGGSIIIDSTDAGMCQFQLEKIILILVMMHL
ncbi:guanine nucleotide exchange factor SPIKE 1-like [Curcuma longa]|uniref:guanine nucleotide exchange factor SPIKE 1-like n=1 Tax=Curcuma longa TaxID=136217 RepID=UPI003D9EA4B2